ncbi:UNVERIFIED_CONTAM: hypothetical protein NY603_36425, partial [Bacteroidetes bacterium 56_B9]
SLEFCLTKMYFFIISIAAKPFSSTFRARPGGRLIGQAVSNDDHLPRIFPAWQHQFSQDKFCEQ